MEINQPADSGGGTPGGTNRQIQYNDFGTFGGADVEYSKTGADVYLQLPPQTTIDTDGDNLTVRAADGNGTGSGGILIMQAGSDDDSVNAGALFILQGGSDTSGSGGGSVMTGGTGANTGGTFQLTGGIGTLGQGGDVIFEGGQGGSANGVVKIRKSGTSNSATLDVDGLSGDIIATFQDASGTIAYLSDISGLGTVTSIDGSGGTTGLTLTGGPVTTAGTLTLGGTLGVVNGGTGTAAAFTPGSVVFAGASGVYSQNNPKLFWDNTNERLGVGTTSPTARVHANVTTINSVPIRASYTAFVGDGEPAIAVVNDSGLTTFTVGKNKTASEGILTMSAPTGQGSGVGVNFNSNVGAGTKTGKFQMDGGGNMVFRAESANMFFDTASSIYFRNSSFVQIMHMNGISANIGRNSSFGSSTLRVYDGTASTGATTLLVQGGADPSDATTNNLFRVNRGGGTTGVFVVSGAGKVGIGLTAPTAVLHLAAGTATANTAPLKFNSGTLLTTAEAGAVEFLTDAFYGTITTGAARKTFAFLESPTFTGTVTAPTVVSTGVVRLKGYTVATLPAGTQGDMCFVTDALAPTFLAALVGGGAVVTKAFYDGTNWVAQ